MNLDKRRQHVTQAASNLGELGAHIPTADQTEEGNSVNSFTFVPPETDSESFNEDREFAIPKGTPSLFEQPEEDIAEVRLEHPSPLHPQELEHISATPALEKPSSLEEKLVKAINSPEAPVQEDAEMEAIDAQVDSGGEEVAQTAVGEYEAAGVSSEEAPHHDHFAEAASQDVIEEQGVEDAGLGAMIMAKRHQEMAKQQKQEVG